MIAKRIRGEMEPVGTIDLGKNGFIFETKDKKLERILKKAQKEGVEVRGGEGEVDGICVDSLHMLKITEETSGVLINYLLGKDYYWWEEE